MRSLESAGAAVGRQSLTSVIRELASNSAPRAKHSHREVKVREEGKGAVGRSIDCPSISWNCPLRILISTLQASPPQVWSLSVLSWHKVQGNLPQRCMFRKKEGPSTLNRESSHTEVGACDTHKPNIGVYLYHEDGGGDAGHGSILKAGCLTVSSVWASGPSTCQKPG